MKNKIILIILLVCMVSIFILVLNKNLNSKNTFHLSEEMHTRDNVISRNFNMLTCETKLALYHFEIKDANEEQKSFLKK